MEHSELALKILSSTTSSALSLIQNNSLVAGLAPPTVQYSVALQCSVPEMYFTVTVRVSVSVFRV